MSMFCCDGGPCAQSSRARPDTSSPAPIVPDSTQARAQQSLPMLQDWEKLGSREKEVVQEKLESIVNAFARELIRGKVFMKLGRNGRLFYRLCTLDKQLSAFSMHIKGAIVEYPFSNMQHISFGYDLTDFTHVPVSLPSDALAAVIVMDNRRMNLVFSSPMERDEFVTCMLVLKERHRRAHKA
uniref:PH domain-containing protein n=1 Tax=Alexandrium catenella TaxID=2925 RepID=A0A7S1MFH0_ALECA|mmetsp:Transcript_24327/g.66340  ORF Transcript_24327/g.66340 Transcript_24327/m.66340 type:complete len:183 (+) Transcript_24327:74-622(+)